MNEVFPQHQRRACKPFSAMIFNNFSAGPEGRVSPCSHFLMVETGNRSMLTHSKLVFLFPLKRQVMKVALLTGASAGFGQAAVRRLIEDGWHVAGAARRAARLEALSQTFGEHFLALPLDVSDRQAVQHAVKTVLDHWGQIDLLINNAGLALGLEPAQQASLDHWDTMIATNVNGVAYVSHAVLPHMVARNRGHIINLGSTAGAYPYKGGNVYGGTKAFVQMFSQNLRADLTGTRVRVTHLAPGLCSHTEFSTVRFDGDQARADAVYEGVEAIKPEDIANTIAWVAAQPEHVNINTIEIMPVAQSFSALSVTRGI